jgi:hypothetical protein
MSEVVYFMSVEMLQAEAENCLAYMHERFGHEMKGRYTVYPLADIKSCRAFGDAVTATLALVRGPDSRLPPTALILAMIKICQAMINPPARAFGEKRLAPIPRAFAYEMLDRLRAELPPSFDFALDQVGRIVTEAGTLQDIGRVRTAMRTFKARVSGALSAVELDLLVSQIWQQRYPHHAEAILGESLRKVA